MPQGAAEVGALHDAPEVREAHEVVADAAHLDVADAVEEGEDERQPHQRDDVEEGGTEHRRSEDPVAARHSHASSRGSVRLPSALLKKRRWRTATESSSTSPSLTAPW